MDKEYKKSDFYSLYLLYNYILEFQKHQIKYKQLSTTYIRKKSKFYQSIYENQKKKEFKELYHEIYQSMKEYKKKKEKKEKEQQLAKDKTSKELTSFLDNFKTFLNGENPLPTDIFKIYETFSSEENSGIKQFHKQQWNQWLTIADLEKTNVIYYFKYKHDHKSIKPHYVGQAKKLKGRIQTHISNAFSHQKHEGLSFALFLCLTDPYDWKISYWESKYLDYDELSIMNKKKSFFPEGLNKKQEFSSEMTLLWNSNKDDNFKKKKGKKIQ
jgi:hypothetical protein